MNEAQNKILAERAIFRANSGLYFLEECLTDIHRGGTDAAFSRSIYILFSFNFELLLKARLLLASKKLDRKDLINEIKSHDLEKLSRKLSLHELNDIGIKSIRKRSNLGFKEYIIEMVNGKNIIVQDLIDVRYDFVRDSLRNIDPDESTRMQSEIEILLGVSKKILEGLNKK